RNLSVVSKYAAPSPTATAIAAVLTTVITGYRASMRRPSSRSSVEKRGTNRTGVVLHVTKYSARQSIDRLTWRQRKGFAELPRLDWINGVRPLSLLHSSPR